MELTKGFVLECRKVNILRDFLCQAIDQVDEKDKELESLKASHYAEMVDAGMRERRLRRALWLARAWFCGRSSEYFSGMASRCKIGQEDFYREVSERARRYFKSSYKCRAMAEKYGEDKNG